MGASYYGTLGPVREPGAGLQTATAALRLPYRALASIGLPAGRVVVAFVSDSAQLSRMFAANWAQAGTGQEPDATLYALVGRACRYGLDESWDRARWWSADHKVMVVFGFGSYRLVKVCVRGICSAVTRDDLLLARMHAVCRGRDWPAWRDHPGRFRGREDHARGEAVAPS